MAVKKISRRVLLLTAPLFMTGSVVSKVAHAQSSVTLYGVMDVGVNYASNVQVIQSGVRTGKPQYYLGSGVIQGNRWGLKGTEDLGGGMKAIFVLENGFDLATGRLGQGGLEFGRIAYVGLSGNKGTATFGRTYDFVIDYVGRFSATLLSWSGAVHPANVNDLNTQLRVNNSIRYVSPVISGVTVGVMYGFGGIAGDFSRNGILSAGLSYANGPVALGAAFISARQPNVSFWGNNSGGGATANNMGSITGVQSNPVFAGYASASRYQVIAVGGSYTLDKATVGLVYTNTGFRNLGDTSAGPNPRGYSGNAIFNDFEINLTYKITPALFAGAAYSFTNGSGPNSTGARYHQANLGLDYFLSKRTDVYIQGFYQTASGIDSTGQSAVASFFNTTPSNINHEGMVRVGMRHRF